MTHGLGNGVIIDTRMQLQLDIEYMRLLYNGATKREWLKLADRYELYNFKTNAKKCRVEAAKVKDV